MIKSLIASLALSTLCIPQVQAHTFNEVDLLEHVKSLGGRVYVDSAYCKENRVYGMQRGGVIHICKENHNGNDEELKDTIRHEVWHIVQMCNNGPILKDPITAITFAHKHGWTGKGYTPQQWHHEAEAHHAAATGSPEDIKTMLDRYCL